MISDDEYNQGLLSTEAELTLDVFGNLMPSDAPPSDEVTTEAARRSRERLDHVEILGGLMTVYAEMMNRQQHRIAREGGTFPADREGMLARAFLGVLAQLMQHGVVTYHQAFLESLDELEGDEDDE